MNAYQYPDVRNLMSAISGLGESGGAEAIAAETGKSRRTIYNELNWKNQTHKLGLVDSITYQLITQRFDVLHEYAAALGHVITPLGDFRLVSDVELLNLYSDWHAKLADVHRSITRALADGRIERHEYQDIIKAFHRSVSVALEFMFRVEAVIDDPT